jgi:hypothetical protein
MIHSGVSAQRALTALATLLMVAPFLGSTHHHEVDHDGAIPHLETDHGGHYHAPPEMDDRVASQGLAPMALPASAWSLPSGYAPQVSVTATVVVDHPARPPPSPTRSRAPPFPT